ncbi:STAS/SEC14 domain-containing protein [Marinobacter sp. BGYM27]|uniref:STAS/SEC14 domain-containing protein n=1 Tax=unclassified Marinobacter TaxID=83889 RepID=UPI0021A81B99|nr:STAS/SEC14 domain-containing protein [Marinobacter sp. BGYM27]MDG5498728.1 STAS/SEC14 domain-containing protein [Marinobacter sp. BGYM27]
MTAQYIEHPDIKTVEIVVDGKFTADDLNTMVPKMKAFIEQHGKVKVLEIVRDFGGFDFAALKDGIKFDMEHLKDYSHCAVVSDSGWVGPVARVMSKFLDLEVRVFKASEEPDARAWIAQV